MILLLDLDEVLCDFIGGACKVHKITREQMEFHRVPGCWDISDAMGRAKTAGMSGFSQNQFWNPIHNAGIGFWWHLEELPWFDEVIQWADTKFESWYIVTSPSNETNSYTGKVNWLKRKFGVKFDRFFITPHKELLAQPGRLLLDDRLVNCEQFKRHGGEAILFPTRGGPLHMLKDDPISYLQQYIGDK